MTLSTDLKELRKLAADELVAAQAQAHSEVQEQEIALHSETYRSCEAFVALHDRLVRIKVRYYSLPWLQILYSEEHRQDVLDSLDSSMGNMESDLENIISTCHDHDLDASEPREL